MGLGFIQTPLRMVDAMVAKLFRDNEPRPGSTLLDPGCGNGAFIDGVIRWCESRAIDIPLITGIEADQSRARVASDRFRGRREVQIRNGDFLSIQSERYDFIIGNPPYVQISAIDPALRLLYRQNYTSAAGRFDLYILFFEQALSLLKPSGRLVFITPEKYLYVQAGSQLRRLLSRVAVEELHFVPEETFANLVTYPLVTTVVADLPNDTIVRQRDESVRRIRQPCGAFSWQSSILGNLPNSSEGPTLADISIRISCGVATGADSVYVVQDREVTADLRQFAYPTLSGREINEPGDLPQTCKSLLVPYNKDGTLIAEANLGALRSFLSIPNRKKKLLSRICVLRKPWYAFHETPPMRHLLRPKILCKDIGSSPVFVIDRAGSTIPRHSVYYIIPKDIEDLDALAEYLNSEPAIDWFRAHCQRAAKGYLRVQSHVLKQLPVPAKFAEDAASSAAEAHRDSA
jgi:hypothetical protein